VASLAALAPVDSTVAETTSSRTRFGTIALITLQLGLVVLVVRQYRLESRTFLWVVALVAAGFPAHALLPPRFRLPFFAGLSLAAIAIALGILNGAALVALGAALIGICHTPVRFSLRVGLLLAVGGVLAAARGGVLPTPLSDAVWPVLGSMFMFRLALYLYALKHQADRPTWMQSFSYFFMLPNVCFPLFPVVDFTTYQRTYYDTDAEAIYARGVRWITRGMVHLLLYRFVYLRLTLDPSELRGLGDLVQFLLATFLLYLRVSGQFHIIVGVLHLFGFRLPETHRLYYLSSSFTDFWRRINIYWKDFMMKLVYYPSFFRLRRHGDRTALVCATIAVFVSTWLLHSYQWFWLRGGFPITAQDGLFWGLLGGIVVVSTLREVRRGRKRTLRGASGWSGSLAVRTVGTFCALCVLWSLWSAESVGSWIAMWGAATSASPSDLLLLVALLGGGLLVAGRTWDAPVHSADHNPKSGRREGLLTAAFLAALLVAGRPSVYENAGPRVASVVVSLRSSTLNARDQALKHKGYYENLDNVSRLGAELWEARGAGEWRWVARTEAYRRRHDFLWADMHPSVKALVKGQVLTTNRWGLRDKDYTLEKPDRTHRIAVIGPSHVMGSGVADGQTFEAQLEERLNRESRSERYDRYEVLNFGFSGVSLVQQAAILDERVLAFNPDLVVMTMPAKGHVGPSLVGHLLRVLGAGIHIPYPDLRQLLDSAGLRDYSPGGVPIPFPVGRSLARVAGVRPRMPEWEAQRRLESLSDALVTWSVRHVAETARAHGITPVFLALDLVTEPPAATVPGLATAREAGFLVLDLIDVYNGHDPMSLRIAAWDDHPNSRANSLIANRLYAELRRNETGLRLDPSVSSSAVRSR
jgi:D-alanyl-lipoteichoic acid acyltransferase DltB (MBOAT superfamily)